MSGSQQRCKSRRLKAVWMLCALAAAMVVAVAVLPVKSVFALQETRLVLSSEAKAIVEANRSKPPDAHREDLLMSFSSLLYHYSNFEDEPDPSRLRRSSVADAEAWSISLSEAQEEVDLLFRVLKYGYAAYQFFGGDEPFGLARERILREIAQQADDISLWQYSYIIRSNLEFIQDGHFVIGNRSPCQWSTFRMSPNLQFSLDEDGHFVNRGGNRLHSINGSAPSSFLKPSIDEDGDIIYVPGMLLPDRQLDSVCELEYEGGTREMAWLVPIVSMDLGGPVYELGEAQGLPIVACRSFDSDRDEGKDLNRFVQDADKLRQEEIILLDLRSNHGGSTLYGMMWCQRLMQRRVGPSMFTANLATDTSIALMLNRQAERRRELDTEEIEALWKYLRNVEDPGRPGWRRIGIEQEGWVSNSPFIVVLIDSNAASATEAFIRRLRGMDNVVFIGTNTPGVVLCGDPGVLVLPHSRLKVRIPAMFWLDSEMQNRDGIGYFPDLWVHPDHALERAVKFVRKHLIEE